MTLILKPTSKTDIPLEVEGITPDIVAGKTLDEIKALNIFHGNRQLPLGDFFDVSGDPDDACIEFVGDLAGVHWIGAGMKHGSIRVKGPAGRHVGSQMSGGQIDIEADAGDWVGGEMSGGLIRVGGNAGHLVGSAYRGSARGMTGGTILVVGDAGNEIGHAMRRGTIAVAGAAEDLIGFNMLAGSIFVFGNSGIRHGAGMRRGTIGLFGPTIPKVLPSFRRACRCQLVILQMIAQALRRVSFPCPIPLAETTVDLYNGDLIDGGRGEMLLRA